MTTVHIARDEPPWAGPPTHTACGWTIAGGRANERTGLPGDQHPRTSHDEHLCDGCLKWAKPWEADPIGVTNRYLTALPLTMPGRSTGRVRKGRRELLALAWLVANHRDEYDRLVGDQHNLDLDEDILDVFSQLGTT